MTKSHVHFFFRTLTNLDFILLSFLNGRKIDWVNIVTDTIRSLRRYSSFGYVKRK